MANKFKHGDVVVLKSGGPPMTINKVPGDEASSISGEPRTNYHCEWFKGASVQRGVFEEHVLETYVKPTK